MKMRQKLFALAGTLPENVKVILLFGPVSAGKSSLSQRLVKLWHIPHISTGDLIREYIANLEKDGNTPQEIKDDMKAGKLINNELVMQLLRQRLKEPDCRGGIILDGAPRALNQVAMVEHALQTAQLPITALILIKTTLEVSLMRAINRWHCDTCGASQNASRDLKFAESIRKAQAKNQQPSCLENGCKGKMIQRIDDTPKTVKKRYREFFDITMPAFEELAQKYPHQIIEILTEVSKEKTTQEIADFVDLVESERDLPLVPLDQNPLDRAA